jgi:nucleoside phosphorylase
MRVLILTPIPKEYQALRKHLDGEYETIYAPELYEKWTFQGKHHKYSIIIREPGAKIADMALATERAIQRFQPDIALLMGIAGGVKDVKIGDVVVANKIYNIDSGKESEDGFSARPDVQKLSNDLLARVQKLERDNQWQNRIKVGDSDTKLYQGAISSSDKLIANVNNPTFQRIKKHLNDTLCVEMEASGFAKSVEMHPKVHGLVIRGISDLCEGKSETDKLGSQEIAADHAAAFLVELLWELDGDYNMNQHSTEEHTSKVSEKIISEDIKVQLIEIGKQISNGRTETAINLLLRLSENELTVWRNDVLSISNKCKEIQSREIRGILTTSEAILERAKIANSILDLISII